LDKSKLRKIRSAGSDKVRVISLSVLLLVVTGIYLRTRFATPEHLEVAPQEAYRPASTVNAPPAAQIEPAFLKAVLDETESDHVTLEREPFLHLLMESGKLVPGDFQRMDTRNLGTELYDEVLSEPQRFRGQAFSARGFFTFSREQSIPLEEGNTPGLRYYQGLVQDDLGRQFSFSVLEPPDRVKPGQIVRIQGFFLKKYSMFHPDQPTEIIGPTLHVVGKRLVPSFYRMDPVHELSPALLSTVRDYELEDQLSLPTEVLYHTLSYVQNTPAEELAAVATDCTSFQLRTNPEEFRGAAVRVLGTFFETWPQHLGPSGENPLDMSTVWHGLLVHGGPSFSYLICTDREEDWVREPNTNVIAEGVFLKRYSYQAKNGEPVTCPLLIVKRFVPFRVDSSGVNHLLQWVLYSLAAIFALWFLISVTSDRKSNEQFRRRLHERRKARVANTGQPRETS
jgi:hypothetical protein